MTNNKSEKKQENPAEEAIDPKALIRRGLKMISNQMDKIEENMDEEGELSPRDAKKLNDYIKVAVQIAKDIKDLGDLSDDELARMSKEEIAALAVEAVQKMGLNLGKKE